MSPEVPAKFGPYRIVQLLGEGGMGAVYEAVHESIERRVAIKVLRPELAKDPAIATRLFNEARAVNIVDHPAIVQISDYGQLPDGTAYLVMELLHGETLARRLKRLAGSLPLVDTLRISRQIAAALIAAHAKGIVHRDLKPDNLMLVPDPEPDRPGRERLKILDFGIAKVAKEATQAAQGSSDKTRQNLVIGTPLYMSPEQCRGSAAVDEKTDVYALGVILYQMLAQRTPFAGDEIGAILAAQIYEAPPPLLEVAPTVPTAIAMLVHRLLVKDKTLRPTMQQVAEELEVLAHSLRVSSTSYDGVQKAAASSNSGVLGRRASPITQDTVPGDATDDSDLSIPTDASLSADSLAKLGTLPGNISSLPMNSSLAVIETAATLSGAQSIAERAYPTEREVRSAGPTLPLRPGKTPGSGDTGEPRRFPRRLGFILPASSGVSAFSRAGHRQKP